MPNRIRRFFGLAARNAEHLSHEVICNELSTDDHKTEHVAAMVFCAALPEDGSVPEWIEILPLGDFSARDGRGPFHADGAAVIAATQANGLERGLPIDYDHRTQIAADSRAAGWIRELQVRANNKMWARVDWTPAATAAIKNKEYRFISPVFRCQPDDPNAPKEEVSGRVLYIRGAGLVNDPALDMTAISFASRTVSMKTKNMKMSEICAALEKMYPDADSDQINALLGAHAQVMQTAADDGDGDEGGDGDGGESMSKENPYAGETEAQARERHATMATERTTKKVVETPEQKGAREARELTEITMAHAHDVEREARGTRTVTRTVRANVANDPMVVKMAKRLGDLEQERAREKAEQTVTAALKDRKILPSQKEWALAYCSADPAGFQAFIGKQPVFIAAQDGSFRGVPESQGDVLDTTAQVLCSKWNLDPKKFAERRTAVLAGKALPQVELLTPSSQDRSAA